METVLPQLEPLEIHSGMVPGKRHSPLPDPGEPVPASTVDQVLDRLLLPAVSRPPCLVAFSGGRDSSSLLAYSTLLARRHGLDDPIPVTLRSDAHPRTWEGDFQEMMVRHLGLSSWEIVPMTELDALGPIARGTLTRHGLYWPGNGHSSVPLCKLARGGSLVTGNGGDEAFLYLVSKARFSLLTALRMNPLRKVLYYLPLQALPQSLRIRITSRRGLRLPWLRPHARREVKRRFYANSARKTGDPRQDLDQLRFSRYFELVRSAFEAFARAEDTYLCEPFFERSFHEAAFAATPPGGFSSRNAAMAHFFGEIMPREVVMRETKAVFTEVFWGPDSRAFAEQWDGSGLDHSLIDPEALRRVWAKPRPDLRSLTPLQAAWLASQA